MGGEVVVYRYAGQARAAHGAAQSVGAPLLMVAAVNDAQGRSVALDVWASLRERLVRDGVGRLYACALPGHASAEALERAIDVALADAGAPALILLAYGDAAAHVRDYVGRGEGDHRVRLLIGLEGRYATHALSYLEGGLWQTGDEAASAALAGPDGAGADLALGAPLIDRFVMVNVYGYARDSIANEATRDVAPLPEAINLGLHLPPGEVLDSPAVYEGLRPFLRGGFWVVRLQLVSFQMRAAAPGAPIGQFYFEVGGQRVPPRGAFAPPDEAAHAFARYTPLGTVALLENKAAANVNLRLRELGRAAAQRRTLFTTLHVPLAHGSASDHVMQDSFGSEIRVRVHCVRVPEMVSVNHDGGTRNAG